MWRSGANLLLVARSGDSLHQLRGQLMTSAQGGQQAHVVMADLSTRDAVPTIIGEAKKIWGQLAVLVNNAAILGPIGRAWLSNWDEWQATIQVNLLAPVELCRACVTWMRECGRGKIINLSGGGASGPRENFSAYATAKAGLVRFSEVLAHEVRGMDVHVNCVAPGTMNTDMLQAILRAGPEKVGATEYARAVQHVEEGDAALQRAADLCVFLASRHSDGITGKLISAVWDPWEGLPKHIDDLRDSDIYTLRRILPTDRGEDWG
jgi:3-oxoacyl-[acyl-carrier protein] reductase